MASECLVKGEQPLAEMQVSKKLDLGQSNFALGKANGQPMLTTEEKNFREMIYVGGEILAED